MKKILIISSVPSHPQNAGNRSRVFRLAEFLKRKHFDLFFVFINERHTDVSGMHAYWGDRLFIFFPIGSKTNTLISRAINKGFSVYSKAYFKIRGFFKKNQEKQDRKYNTFVDQNYFIGLNGYLKKIQKANRFDVVIVEYVFLSKAFLAFEPNVLKILDTHDVFTNRFKIYLKNGVKPEWVSLYKEEEAIGLDRADVIMAIQEREKMFFESLTAKKVIVFGDQVVRHELDNNYTFEKHLLFISSDNSINIDGINKFIVEVFQEVKIRYPEIKLLIAGSINKSKGKIVKDCSICFLGEFDDVRQVFKQGEIVINPIVFGSGLKIKTIEALSYGKLLVTYPEGLSGLRVNKENEYCLVCQNSNEFKNSIFSLIEDSGLRARMSKAALEFIEKYNCETSKELIEILK